MTGRFEGFEITLLSLHPYPAQGSILPALTGFFGELRPARIERIIFMLRGIQLGKRFLQCRGVGSDLRMLHAVPRRRQPRIRHFHALLDRGKLPRFVIGEFFLRGVGGVSL